MPLGSPASPVLTPKVSSSPCRSNTPPRTPSAPLRPRNQKRNSNSRFDTTLPCCKLGFHHAVAVAAAWNKHRKYRWGDNRASSCQLLVVNTALNQTSPAYSQHPPHFHKCWWFSAWGFCCLPCSLHQRAGNALIKVEPVKQLADQRPAD